MAEPEAEHTQGLEPELRDMKLEEGATTSEDDQDERAIKVKVESDSGRSQTSSPSTPWHNSRLNLQPLIKEDPSEVLSFKTDPQEEVLGGEITVKMEPGKAPKLSRTASQKVVSRPPPLLLDLPDATEIAKQTFSVLTECTYGNKSLGTTEHALECDCSEEWDAVARINNACGDDSDCINRATKMECVGDCGCGRKCQNQRFSRKQYAHVTVIQTAKKGFGLRAGADLKPGDFIFEYIGEVIDERAFRRRMVQYDQEGIKHFYFMSLNKGEFVDATKKGNLGRFCNHSCNPNCYVDKWVVGDKLRMGIFAERYVRAGEELVFNYNVDRYGADPQPCYCGEPNCSGYIGGKTQSGTTTKLSHATLEALGIEDGAGWDTAVVKKPRRKKASEDDEEYVSNLEPKSLDETGVKKIMPTLSQCKEKWIAVKLLDRLQKLNHVENPEDEKVQTVVVRFHGYNILKKTLLEWKADSNVILQVLDVLYKLPRITRNKISDSGIEDVVGRLKMEAEDDQVQSQAAILIETWSKLDIAYRIKKRARDSKEGTPVRIANHFERREKGRERSRSRSKSPALKPPTGAPSGPRGFNAPKGPAALFSTTRPPPRPRPPQHIEPPPPGWFLAKNEVGRVYYYKSDGTRQWHRPTQPAEPTTSVKTHSKTQALQDIISNLTANLTPTHQPSLATTPLPSSDQPAQRKHGDKWRDVPQEKKEKIYEQTISKHVLSVASRYKATLDREDIKKLSKEVAKKLVRGDFKAGRVKNPKAPIDSKHEKKIKEYVKDFMDKAVKKKIGRQRTKPAVAGAAASTPTAQSGEDLGLAEQKASPSGDDDNDDDNVGDIEASPVESATAKRKWDEDDLASPKKSRIEASPPLPPPPPPPPPPEDMPPDVEESTLTPLEEYNSFDEPDAHQRVDEDLKRLPLDDASPTQLATPPTNGLSAKSECFEEIPKEKRTMTASGGLV